MRGGGHPKVVHYVFSTLSSGGIYLRTSMFYSTVSTYFASLLAPVAAPQNVKATSHNATSITVCFEYPEESTQNGQITSYNVTLVGSPFDSESQTVSIPVTSTNYPLIGSVCHDVHNLEEYNNYTITLSLTNSVGSGSPNTEVEIRTQQAGMS